MIKLDDKVCMNTKLANNNYITIKLGTRKVFEVRRKSFKTSFESMPLC